MTGYRKLIGFAVAAVLVFILAYTNHDKGSGVDLIGWIYGLFVTGNAAVHVGTGLAAKVE